MKRRNTLFIGAIIGLAMVQLAAIFSPLVLALPEPLATTGSDYQRSSNIYDKTVYRLGNRIVVNDLINGDLYCMGNTVIVDAVINGDILCAGSSVVVKGSVDGSVRIVAKDITISGAVNSNATLIASNVTIAKNARITNDASIIAQTITINGEIGRDVTARADVISISGRIGRTLETYHSSMTLTASASVGAISYSSPNKINIQTGAKYGSITEIETSAPSYVSSFMGNTVFLAALLYVAWFISLILTALCIAFLFPKSLEDSARSARQQPLVTGVAGLLATLLVPITIILLAMSVIGIPLALIIGLLYAAVVLLSTPFFAHLIGTGLFPHRSHPVRSLVGAVLLLLLYAIPLINIVAAVFVTIYGTGLIVRLVVQRYTVAAQSYKKESHVNAS